VRSLGVRTTSIYLSPKMSLDHALAFGFGAQNVARDIVERAYDRRRDEVRGEPTVRESSTQGEAVPRARRLHREEEE
jgi:hypothetical protein